MTGDVQTLFLYRLFFLWRAAECINCVTSSSFSPQWLQLGTDGPVNGSKVVSLFAHCPFHLSHSGCVAILAFIIRHGFCSLHLQVSASREFYRDSSLAVLGILLVILGDLSQFCPYCLNLRTIWTMISIFGIHSCFGPPLERRKTHKVLEYRINPLRET